MEMKTFHSLVAILTITKFIVETEEAFDTEDFSVIDAFHTSDPMNLPTIVLSGYGLN